MFMTVYSYYVCFNDFSSNKRFLQFINVCIISLPHLDQVSGTRCTRRDSNLEFQALVKPNGPKVLRKLQV